MLTRTPRTTQEGTRHAGPGTPLQTTGRAGRRAATRVRSGAVALLLTTLAACSGSTDPAASDGGPRSSTTTTTTRPAVSGTSSDDGCDTTSTVRRDLAYGRDSDLQRLDLYVPDRAEGCEPAPVVVWVHGGGYRTGDKANRIEDKVRLFTGEGYVLAAVNYRLSAGAEAVRYPAHQQDVAAATAWLVDHADEYGIDPDRILLLGHSSGANLVSVLSTDARFFREAGLDPAQVRCTVSNDTEYDVAEQIEQGGATEALYRNAIGDDPVAWEQASPILNVDDGTDVPAFLVITRGRGTRTARAEAFVETLTDAGVPARLLDVNPLDHEEANAALGDPDDEVVTPAVLDFFEACAAGRTPFADEG